MKNATFKKYHEIVNKCSGMIIGVWEGETLPETIESMVADVGALHGGKQNLTLGAEYIVDTVSREVYSARKYIGRIPRGKTLAEWL